MLDADCEQLIGRPLLDDSIYGYLHNRFEVGRDGSYSMICKC